MSRVKRILKVVFFYIKALYRTLNHGHNWSGNKYVYFDLADPRVGAYYFQLIYHFHVSGYNILIRNRIKFIGNCQKSDQHIFTLPSVKLGLAPSKKEKFIYVRDKKVEREKGDWLKSVLLDPNIFRSKKVDSSLFLPLSFNPALLLETDLTVLPLLEFSKRKMRIVFSGNQNTVKYDDPVIRDFFHKLSRIRIFDVITKELTSDELNVITSAEDLLELNSSYYHPKLIWIKWSWSPDKQENLNLRVKNSEWFAFLAKSDFFLATPGILMPLCFNVIEAMAVGTIPVLQYADSFHPPLTDGVNCISFSNEHDLIPTIRRVLAMNEHEVGLLRIGVLEYYKKYLELGCITKKIESVHDSSLNLYFHATQVSLDEFKMVK